MNDEELKKRLDLLDERLRLAKGDIRDDLFSVKMLLYVILFLLVILSTMISFK